jgi:hypothetical protein
MAILPLRTKKKEAPEEAANELPPFLAMTAVYRDRLRVAKAWTIGVTVVCLVLLALQEARFHGALGKYTNREILIVPGAVDFMRVRPNILPDNVVYYFAEYIAEAVGTFNHLNVETKANRVGEFFTPQFRERYLSDLRRNLKTWRELSVTEVFVPSPATKFTLRKDDQGTPHYVVDVHGQLDRYSNDTKLLSTPEVLTIKFRTSRIVAERPWFFEVEDITRMSLEEWSRDKDARERLGSK